MRILILFLVLIPSITYAHSEEYEYELWLRNQRRIERRMLVGYQRLLRIEARRNYWYSKYQPYRETYLENYKW